MEKYLFIGDSHRSALLPIKIALFLGIPFLMGKGYCSSTDWPNVSRFDGNGNGDGMVMVMLMVSFLLYISSTPQSIFPFASLELQVPKLCKKWGGDKNTVLVLQAPCNDITNCSKMEKKAQEKMARRSSENTLKVASDAMVKFGIQKVLILARPRRNDQMEKLSTLSNEIFECFERNGIFFVDNKGGVQKYYPNWIHQVSFLFVQKYVR